MKASTLFVISIALLIGLGAAAGAKYIGLFDKNGKPVESKVKEEPILVLVANTDLYKNIAIGPGDVRVRELYPEERDFYLQNRGNFLPAFVSAASLRVPERNIRADEVLRRRDFKEDQPEPVSIRLEPEMRAVTVAVPKERCAGGLIQLGEYVDVWLTTRVSLSDGVGPEKTVVRTASLARECRVIVKRNNLRTVLASNDADGAPVSFVLQADPYRAALIEYAQYKGQLSLVPVPTDKARPLDSSSRDAGMPRSFADMTSKEYRDEDARVEAIRKGELVVGDADLERIFQVLPPPPKTPPIVVRRISGIAREGNMIFSGDRGAYIEASGTGPNGSSSSRGQPEVGFSNGEAKKDCPTCGKKKDDAKDTFTPPMK